MTDFAALEQHLTSTLSLTRRPVAIAFRESPPAGVEKLSGTQPSGCSFWRLAAARTDLLHGAVGSLQLSGRQLHAQHPAAERARAGVDEHAVADGERRLSEDGRSPRHSAARGDAGGGDLRAAGDDARGARCGARVRHAGSPDAAARSGDARDARGTTQASPLPLLGRPTCMAIPAALSSGVASSLGCIGNRVYTGIADDEFYTVIAGKDLASVVARARHDRLGQRGADRLSQGPPRFAGVGVA